MLIFDHFLGRVFDALANVGAAAELPGIPGYNLEKSLFNNGKPSFAGPPGLVDEFQTICNESPLDAVATLARAFISLPYFRKLTGEPSGPHGTNGPSSFPKERWFFINGVCSDIAIATANQSAISDLVGRPVELLYNATDGVWTDVVECAFGKTFSSVTEAAALNMAPLVDALCDNTLERVVLVSHSQGTIVAAVLLKVLQEKLFRSTVPLVGSAKPSGERTVARALLRQGKRQRVLPGLLKQAQAIWLAGSKEAVKKFDDAIKKLEADLADEAARKRAIGKLELYCFANCATSMSPFVQLDSPARRAPWIESYGNQNDLVARLGVLARVHGIGGARIDGDSYYRADAWGHLLNAHYLTAMYEGMKPVPVESARWQPYPGNLRSKPRLWDYVGGSTPSGPV